MSNTATTSPTDIAFYDNHTDENIAALIERHLSTSLWMQTNGSPEWMVAETLAQYAACVGQSMKRGMAAG